MTSASDNSKKARPFRVIVTSDKMDKSRVGTFERLVKHPRYGKYQRRRTKLMFHDAKNETRIGDEVLIGASSPMSARKAFTLLEILKKGSGPVEEIG